MENDSYAWLAHARDLIDSGGWRLRHTYMDNAPYGRPMHWSHLLLWSILLPSKTVMALAHWPASRSIELVGVWVMPAWQIVFLALLFFALPRCIGLIPSAFFAFLSVANECMASSTFPLKPDHHVFQMAFGIAFFLCLQRAASVGLPASAAAPLPPRRIPLYGFPLPPSPAEALQAATIAGVFLGLLYWIGATVASVVLASSALAVLPLLPCFRFSALAPSPLFLPLWRRLAVVAVSIASACWLLEYAPNHFSMSLEVNHPLHWLSILGVSLGLSFVSTLPRRPRPADFLSLRLLLAVARCAALPHPIALGPVSWHHFKDPLLQRLHRTHIVECLPGASTPSAILAAYRIPALALLAFPLLLFPKSCALPKRARPVLLSAWIFAFFFLAAAAWQRRWGYLSAAAIYSLATLLCLALLETRPRRFPRLPATAALLAAALTLADAVWTIHARFRLENRIAIAAAPPALRDEMYKRLALRLADRMGTNRWVISDAPSDAPVFYYFAGIPALASYYWENLDGWHAESALMSDTSPGFTNALAIARERGITHFLTSFPSDNPPLFLHLATGISDSALARTATFCGQLSDSGLFTNLPPDLFDDPKLNAAVTAPVSVRTPFGAGQMVSQLHIFTLPGNGQK